MLRSLIIAVFLLHAGGALAQNTDLSTGYYFPAITSQETFNRILVKTQTSGRDVRVGFITSITMAQLEAPESPRFVVFAKGTQAEKLIIVALDDEIFKTLYRARAILAQLTSNVRANFFAGQEDLERTATFFDLLQMMQFKSLVITDGENWAHKVIFVLEE